MPVSMAVNVTSLVLLIVKKARVTYKVELVSRVTLGGLINFAIKVRPQVNVFYDISFQL